MPDQVAEYGRIGALEKRTIVNVDRHWASPPRAGRRQATGTLAGLPLAFSVRGHLRLKESRWFVGTWMDSSHQEFLGIKPTPQALLQERGFS